METGCRARHRALLLAAALAAAALAAAAAQAAAIAAIERLAEAAREADFHRIAVAAVAHPLSQPCVATAACIWPARRTLSRSD